MIRWSTPAVPLPHSPLWNPVGAAKLLPAPTGVSTALAAQCSSLGSMGSPYAPASYYPNNLASSSPHTPLQIRSQSASLLIPHSCSMPLQRWQGVGGSQTRSSRAGGT